MSTNGQNEQPSTYGETGSSVLNLVFPKIYRYEPRKNFRETVDSLLKETLLSEQLYLRPLCLKPRFNSHINSALLHSRERTFPYAPADTFRDKQALQRLSYKQALYLVFTNQFHIAVRHDDFTVIVQYHISMFALSSSTSGYIPRHS